MGKRDLGHFSSVFVFVFVFVVVVVFVSEILQRAGARWVKETWATFHPSHHAAISFRPQGLQPTCHSGGGTVFPFALCTCFCISLDCICICIFLLQPKSLNVINMSLKTFVSGSTLDIESISSECIYIHLRGKKGTICNAFERY